MAVTQIQTGPQRVGDDSLVTLRGGKDGEAMLSQMNARYYEQVYRGRVFCCTAIGISANVIYSTAAGTGGPLIWNPPGSGVNVVLLKVGLAVTTLPSAAALLGVTGAAGQLLAPTTTTAIDAPVRNTFFGFGPPAGQTSQVVAYRIGTVTNAGITFMGLFFVPIIPGGTGAATTIPAGLLNAPALHFVDLEGSVMAAPGSWLSCSSGSATLTAGTTTCSAMWAEVPI